MRMMRATVPEVQLSNVLKLVAWLKKYPMGIKTFQVPNPLPILEINQHLVGYHWLVIPYQPLLLMVDWLSWQESLITNDHYHPSSVRTMNDDPPLMANWFRNAAGADQSKCVLSHRMVGPPEE